MHSTVLSFFFFFSLPCSSSPPTSYLNLKRRQYLPGMPLTPEPKGKWSNIIQNRWCYRTTTPHLSPPPPLPIFIGSLLPLLTLHLLSSPFNSCEGHKNWRKHCHDSRNHSRITISKFPMTWHGIFRSPEGNSSLNISRRQGGLQLTSSTLHTQQVAKSLCRGVYSTVVLIWWGDIAF